MKPCAITLLFSVVWFLSGCDDSRSVKVTELESKVDELKQENRVLRDDLSRLQAANTTLDQNNRQAYQRIQDQEQQMATLKAQFAAQTATVERLAGEKAALEQRLAVATQPPPAPLPAAAPAQVPPEIRAIIQEAVQCKDYVAASARLKECAGFVSAMADNETKELARAQVLLAREGCLNNEITRLFTSLQTTKSKIQRPFLGTRIRKGLSDSTGSYIGQVYSDEAEYKAANVLYQSCLRYNAEVRNFNDTATVIKRRIEELRVLQADKRMTWTVDPSVLTAELAQLQEGTSPIPISGAPKLVKREESRPSTIGVGPVISH